MITKYSHGKRIFWGQSDAWEVYQLLVVGRKSDLKFEDSLQSYDGIVSSYVRDVNTEKLIKKKK